MAADTPLSAIEEHEKRVNWMIEALDHRGRREVEGIMSLTISEEEYQAMRAAVLVSLKAEKLLDELEQHRYAEAEHEHLGCHVAKTGIYAPPSQLQRKEGDELRLSDGGIDQSARAGEPSAWIVENPKGDKSVTLKNAEAPEFWINGKIAEGYKVTPLYARSSTRECFVPGCEHPRGVCKIPQAVYCGCVAARIAPSARGEMVPVGVVNTDGGVTWDVSPWDLNPKAFVYVLKGSAP